ncbi:MAG: hypothetical protein Q7V19_10150 [Bacteroidales bacterium]|nr:hypothetical protein [Bacteroidales bacterium]
MILQKKTLVRLRDLINEETEYRKGHELVAFFNELGFKETYGQGFPSRWIYTDSKLEKINGTPELDKCIKKVFAPVNFVGRIDVLDKFIADFNQFLVFEDWQVKRIGKEITFTKAGKIDFEQQKSEVKEDDFLNREFSDVSIEKIGLDGTISDVLASRFEEIQKCFRAKSWLSVIIMSGSTLEGLLLGVALTNLQLFDSSNSSPKTKEGKIKQFHLWTLSNFIDVAAEIGMLKEDVKKFSHVLREFRNYIHPFEQMSSKFYPDEKTAKICLQVLNAAIFQMTNNRK